MIVAVVRNVHVIGVAAGEVPQVRLFGAVFYSGGAGVVATRLPVVVVIVVVGGSLSNAHLIPLGTREVYGRGGVVVVVGDIYIGEGRHLGHLLALGAACDLVAEHILAIDDGGCFPVAPVGGKRTHGLGGQTEVGVVVGAGMGECNAGSVEGDDVVVDASLNGQLGRILPFAINGGERVVFVDHGIVASRLSKGVAGIGDGCCGTRVGKDGKAVSPVVGVGDEEVLIVAVGIGIEQLHGIHLGG